MIGIATSILPLPADEQLLLRALEDLGLEARPVLWRDAAAPGFHAVVIRSCWDYHLHVDEFLAWLEALQQAGVAIVNPPDLIRWNVRKTYLAELGVAIPETVFVPAGETIHVAGLCARRGWTEAVVKPEVSASAHQTRRLRDGAVDGPALVQQFIPAIATHGEWSLMYFNGEFSHAMVKKPRPGDFRVQKEFGGSAVPVEPPAEALAFAESVLAKLRCRPVFARVDVLADPANMRLMELELIEPELFVSYAKGAPGRLARAIRDRLKQ